MGVQPYSLAGSRIEVPYGATALMTEDVLHVAEGEVDCETLREAGAGHVVGVPGASTWREQWTRWIWDADPRRVVFWPDNDPDHGAGLQGARSARATLDRRVATRLVRLPPGDVNDLWRSEPDLLRSTIWECEQQ